MTYDLNPPRTLCVTDDNGALDPRGHDLFGPVYFDVNGNMFIVDYRLEFVWDGEKGGKKKVVEYLMPPDAWMRRKKGQIEKLNQRNQ